MKRSELKVGEAYYYTRSRDYMKWSDGVKAVVVSTRVGRNVKVDLHYTYGVIPTEVPTAHLHGPWEETKAAVDQAADERRKANKAARAETNRIRRLAEDALNRAHALGIKAQATPGYGMPHDEIRMSVDEFMKLLDAVERAP